jgi:ethanolamine ammonia-lyase small subunit
MALSREDYLMHPTAGERIRDEDSVHVVRLYASSRKPTIQVVISDGLNADAVHENLRFILSSLKRQIFASGHHVGETEIVVENGRVRAGYHIGGLLDVDVVIHFIGERPGTGLNTLSAYITYGRTREGVTRWSPDLDHSNTTAVCGIHKLGKPPEEAAEEIARIVHRQIEQCRSGVVLD